MKALLKFLLLGCALIVICLFGLTQCNRIPSNTVLSDYFYSHKATYSALLDMLHEDAEITRICQGQIAIHDPKDDLSNILTKPIEQTSFSHDRFIQYEKLIALVESDSIWQHEDKSVLFSKGGWGMSGTGVRWGYAWMKTPPPNNAMLMSMDDFLKKGPYDHNTWRFVHIEEQWYMYIAAP